MKIILGLGNPGGEYEKTPHNVGFIFVDRFAGMLDESFCFSEKSEFHAMCQMFKSPGVENIFFVKPMLFMNNSGVVARKILDYYKELPDSLIVVHDEADLAVGSARLSYGRGAAGHNGVQSIIDSLGTASFHRLRIGIDIDYARKNGLDSFVLSPMSKEFFQLLEKGVVEGVNIMKGFLGR